MNEHEEWEKELYERFAFVKDDAFVITPSGVRQSLIDFIRSHKKQWEEEARKEGARKAVKYIERHATEVLDQDTKAVLEYLVAHDMLDAAKEV